MRSSTIKSTIIAIEWLGSLSAKFMRVVPAYTTAAAMSTLLAQLATLLAFLLPIKVIILLGSDGVPRYFPPFLSDMEPGRLISLLATGAVGFYVTSLIANRAADRFIERGASDLLLRSRKIVLFENQDGLARRAYQRFAASAAALLFLVLAAACLAIMYPLLLAFLASYVLLASALLHLGYPHSRTVSQWVDKDFSNAINLLADAGFLSSFAFIVLNFLVGSPPGVLIGLLSMILTRQWTQRTAVLVQGVHALSAQRVQLSALFFHGQALSTQHQSVSNNYWQLLQKSRRLDWLSSELSVLEGCTIEVQEAKWHQTSIPGVAGIRVHASHDQISREYLVKLFNKNSQAMAQHEATLLAEVQTELPTLPFIGASAIEGLQIHAFRWDDVGSIPAGSLGVQGRALAASLLRQELPSDLVDRCERSRTLLPKRVTGDLIERLRIAANEGADSELLDKTSQRLPQIRQALASLPKQLTNVGQTADTLRIAADGQTISTHWGRWTIEPIGATWPLDPALWQQMYDAMTKAAEDRPSLRTIREQSVRMCSLSFEIDRLARGEQLSTAIGLLPELLDIVAELEYEADETVAVARS